MPSLHGYWGRLRAASKMSVGTTGFAVETKLVSLSLFFFFGTKHSLGASDRT